MHGNPYKMNSYERFFLFFFLLTIFILLAAVHTEWVKNIDKPTVSIRFEPPSPIIENDRVNVTLHCDVVDGNPRKLLKVQWMINGDVLTELPECNGTKIFFISLWN